MSVLNFIVSQCDIVLLSSYQFDQFMVGKTTIVALPTINCVIRLLILQKVQFQTWFESPIVIFRSTEYTFNLFAIVQRTTIIDLTSELQSDYMLLLITSDSIDSFKRRQRSSTRITDIRVRIQKCVYMLLIVGNCPKHILSKSLTIKHPGSVGLISI